ncbi:MAG: glycosyl hydrolase family 28-related protein, partial [Bacteroidota bacterium]
MSRVNFRITKTISKLGKMAMITIIAMFVATTANAQGEANRQRANQRSIKTIYPTKDWVISDFVVTDLKFGANAKPGFDNRAAFQAAIDAAYNNGGGVVYIPAGNYEFRSTQTATRNVRVRQGTEETTKDFNYQYVLNIPTSVQLRGDWADPELNKGKVLGTILEVRVGKNAPNYNG